MPKNEQKTQEQIKEEIKISTEMLRISAVLFLALTSGLLSLLFNGGRSEAQNLMLYAGSAVFLLNVFAIYFYNRYIYQLIKKLK